METQWSLWGRKWNLSATYIYFTHQRFKTLLYTYLHREECWLLRFVDSKSSTLRIHSLSQRIVQTLYINAETSREETFEIVRWHVLLNSEALSSDICFTTKPLHFPGDILASWNTYTPQNLVWYTGRVTSHRFPTAAAQVWFQVMWETKWYWGRFSPSTSVSPANSHSTDYSTLIIYYPGLVQ
jgi:hypothetical protein